MSVSLCVLRCHYVIYIYIYIFRNRRFLQNIELNTDSNIITKFKDDPNIFKIRKIHLMIGIFHFFISEAAISAGIKNMINYVFSS